MRVIEEKEIELIMTAPVAGHNFPALGALLRGEYIKIGKIGDR